MKDVRLYLRDILDRLERIERFTAEGHDAFMQSDLIQDGVLRNFQVIGEATKRLPDAFRQQHAVIPWRRMTGLRDVVVHEYDKLMLDEIWTTIEQDLLPLKPHLQALLAQLGRESPPDTLS